MDTLDKKIKQEIAPERRRELEEYVQHQGLELTRQEERKWEKGMSRPLGYRTEPTAEELRICKEEENEHSRLESYAPRIALEVLYAERVKRRLQEDKTQKMADRADEIAPAVKAISEITQQLSTQRSADQKKAQLLVASKRKIKRARGKKGGRTPDDGQEQIKKAVAKVLELREYNKFQSMTMERACENAIKKLSLSIQWEALAKHVRKSPKWQTLKKRIRIARK